MRQQNSLRLALTAAAGLLLIGLTSCARSTPPSPVKNPPGSNNSPDAQLQKHIQQGQGQQGGQGGQ